MRTFLKTVVLAAFICSAGPCAFAQWDSRGCSDFGTNINYPETIESSLWTFRSDVWDGYIDFQEKGKYWTHWGSGTWTVNPNGSVTMANDYNGKSYNIIFTDSGFRFEGVRNDGLKISGRLLCAKYDGPGPQVSADVEKSIVNFYKRILGRSPNHDELVGRFREYNKGTSLSAIREEVKAMRPAPPPSSAEVTTGLGY
jgi:hypothetical protein